MYILESFSENGALITNTLFSYNSTFTAESQSAAIAIVVGLNQEALLEQLSQHRYGFEVTNITLTDGLSIKTDRESQAQLNSAYTTLKYGLIPDTDWKAANGWAVVTLEQIEPIAKAVAAHVRGCFRGERTVQEAINAASTIQQIEGIDIVGDFAAAYRVAFTEVMEA